MLLRFTKMHGAGNDFVVIDSRNGAGRPVTAELARAVLGAVNAVAGAGRGGGPGRCGRRPRARRPPGGAGARGGADLVGDQRLCHAENRVRNDGDRRGFQARQPPGVGDVPHDRDPKGEESKRDNRRHGEREPRREHAEVAGAL